MEITCFPEINECDSNPCQNGATCVDELNRYSCTCQPGYQGTNCETGDRDIDGGFLKSNSFEY